MKVLIVTGDSPYPPTTGSDLRTFNLLRQVSRQHEVSLLSLYTPFSEEEDGAVFLKTLCSRVELIAKRKRAKREHVLRLLKGTWQGEPIRNVFIYFEEMANRIGVLTEAEHFDIIQFHHSYMGPYVKAISPLNRSGTILFMHNVAYMQFRRMMFVARGWRSKRKFFLNWLFLKRATLKYMRLFDKCIVVSELDRDILKRDAPDLDVVALPGGVDIEEYPFLPEQSTTPTLILVGKMSYTPNVDGAIFFCNEVLPLIKQQVPDARLLIVGRDPTRSIQALASEDVVVTGYVESVIPYYQQSLASVVPLRAGGGTRLKIPESMALGRPVVSTTLGCEGLDVNHGENILIADTPVDFAAQTVRLLKDDQLRQRIVANGRHLVETKYDWQVVGSHLLQIYDQVAGQVIRRG